MQQIGQALVGHRTPANVERNVLVLRTVDLLRLESLQKRDGLGNPRLQFRDARVIVPVLRHLHTREPRRPALGMIRGDMDLPGRGNMSGKSRAPSNTAGSILRASAWAAALSRMAERLPSMWMKTGTEAWYREIAMGVLLVVGGGIVTPATRVELTSYEAGNSCNPSFDHSAGSRGLSALTLRVRRV